MRLDSQPYFLAHTKYLEATFPHRVQITVIKCENMFTAAVNFTACKIQLLVIVLKVYNQRGKGESQLV